MLDVATMTCPCLYGIMNVFDINWKKVPGGKQWFMSQLGPCIQEMYANGNIAEGYYNEMQFPIDEDKKGNKYVLNSEKDHMCRSKILYHPKVVNDFFFNPRQNICYQRN